MTPLMNPPATGTNSLGQRAVVHSFAEPPPSARGVPARSSGVSLATCAAASAVAVCLTLLVVGWANRPPRLSPQRALEAESRARTLAAAWQGAKPCAPWTDIVLTAYQKHCRGRASEAELFEVLSYHPRARREAFWKWSVSNIVHEHPEIIYAVNQPEPSCAIFRLPTTWFKDSAASQ